MNLQRAKLYKQKHICYHKLLSILNLSCVIYLNRQFIAEQTAEKLLNLSNDKLSIVNFNVRILKNIEKNKTILQK